VVVPAPELSSIDVAVAGYLGMIGTFRKGQVFSAYPELFGLLGKLSYHRPPDGRRRDGLRLRRFSRLNRFLGLSCLPWRGIGECHDQGDRPDNGAQYAGDGFRIHRGIPWLVWRPLIILPVAAPRRIAYFAAALCLINAFTISACASAMALFAVVMWSPASMSGNCIDK